MKRIITIMFLVSIFLLPCLSEGQTITSQNFNWYINNHELVRIKIKSGSNFEVVPIINTICTIWKYRDGGIGAEISPAIADALIHQPQLTLSWFEQNPAEYESWLNRLPYSLLTDYSGDREKEIEKQRVELISSLYKYIEDTDNDRHSVLAHKLIEKLESSKVRTID